MTNSMQQQRIGQCHSWLGFGKQWSELAGRIRRQMQMYCWVNETSSIFDTIWHQKQQGFWMIFWKVKWLENQQEGRDWTWYSAIYLRLYMLLHNEYWCQLVSWSLTSLFSTNMAISETRVLVSDRQCKGSSMSPSRNQWIKASGQLSLVG